MSNQLTALLTRWSGHKEAQNWVLGTIVETQGSSYRKAGAMIFINDLGQHFGLISGGCLESDLMRQAQKVMDRQQPSYVQYDMRDESDMSWQLGIGCGGMVKLLLQPLNRDNDYHQLPELLQELKRNKRANYQLSLTEPEQSNRVIQAAQTVTDDTLIIELKAEPHLAIFGAGVDARPLVAMAGTLGWQTTLVDHRPTHGRAPYFSSAQTIIRQHPNQLKGSEFLQQIDAVVIMGHSLSFDAAALELVQSSSSRYVGLLGPAHRKEKIVARVSCPSLLKPLIGPIGLNLGGELPESIALSILAEIHAVLENQDARTLSGQLPYSTDSTANISARV